MIRGSIDDEIVAVAGRKARRMEVVKHPTGME
jgi:hypothetical protein